MTSGAPWSVKGIDPKAREIAKDLAQRSGMTLGEWFNQMILEDGAKPETEETRIQSLSVARASGDSPRSEDLSRVLASLESLSERLEFSERHQAQTSARFEAALADLRLDQAKVAERLQTVGGGGGRADTLRALDSALGQLGKHIQEGEGRNREALVAVRQEVKDEIDRVAVQMDLKVQELENRGTDAIAQVGAEVTRVASVVEQRLRRADDAQAEALEKLGAEIARITERLSERIAAAERRSAQAIDDVGEQMARVTDRIHQRQERTLSEIGDRVRQSEERTARLLEDAREKIERRLGKREEPDAPATEAPAAEAPVAEAVEELPAPAPVPRRWSNSVAGPPPPSLYSPGTPEPAPVFLDPPAISGTVEAAFADVERSMHAEPAPQQQEPDDGDRSIDDGAEEAAHAHGRTVADMLAAASFFADGDSDHHHADAASLRDVDGSRASAWAAPHSASDPSEEETRPSTRDLLAAARAAASFHKGEPSYSAVDMADDLDTDSIYSDMGPRKGRMSGSMRVALLTGGAALSLGLAASGYVKMHPEMMASLNAGASIKSAEVSKPIPVGPAPPPAAPPAPQPAAQAMSVTTAAPKSAAANQDLDAASLFRDATVKVDVGDPAGVEPLRIAANLGYAPAQRRLGKLYEDGGAGVQKDAVEGRRWTQQAAANGDARGMHNLGLDYYEGAGGIRNMAVAAQWFQRAAELGLRDSQYNLARFYESGLGVKQDPAAAYKWYLIAGRAGDTEAAARGEALKPLISAQVRAEVEHEAMAFRPEPEPPPTSMTAALRGATPQQLALAQRALSKLGYYQGAKDGTPSRGLGEAIQAYQRDRRMAANGALSPELLQTFANVSR
jgi:localization factor PodJL